MARDEQALRDAMEHSAAVLAAAGFPKMPARVLMALTVADAGGLTAQELAKSSASARRRFPGRCATCRPSATCGALRRPAAGETATSCLPISAYGASFRKSPLFDSLASLLDRAVEAIDDPTSPASIRSEEMARFYRFLGTRMPSLLDEWEEIRNVR